MSAVEHELWEQIRKLDPRQQRRVLDFVQRLAQRATAESPTWTEQEIDELMKPQRKTFTELIAWLDTNPPTESWGDLKDNETAAEYIQRMRRQNVIDLDDLGADA